MRARMIQLAAIGLLGIAGCGGGDVAQPLDSSAFYRRSRIEPGYSAGGPRSPVGPVDEAGRVDPIVRKPEHGDSVSGISDTVAESTNATRTPPARPLVWAPPSTVPTTNRVAAAPTTLPTGQYMIVGVVLADVDGSPIYADQVLSVIDKPLQIEARNLDEPAFRKFAKDKIEKEVQSEIRNHVVYRAAERSLNEADRKLVDMLTTKWRQDKIIEAGGSVELAHRKARADRIEFDKLVEDQHSYYMTQVYYEKKVIPLIVVTADMMREYYDRNLTKLFTDKTAAKFRIVATNAKEVGSRETAQARAKEWQRKLVESTDDEFAAFAHENNKDLNLKNRYGISNGRTDRSRGVCDQAGGRCRLGARAGAGVRRHQRRR